MLIIFAGTNRYLDDIPVEDVRRFEKELYSFMETNFSNALKTIAQKKALDDAVRAEMKKALDEFKQQFVAAGSKSSEVAAD